MTVLFWGVILPKKRDKLNLWGLFTSILNIKKGVQILSSRLELTYIKYFDVS